MFDSRMSLEPHKNITTNKATEILGFIRRNSKEFKLTIRTL